MSLSRMSVRDFVIVQALDLDFSKGFSVLTGETGAGKSILIDALQLALGARGDAMVVREGAARCEISVEFEPPTAVSAWLEQGGFAVEEHLLVKRSIDAQGKSRAWINGSAATISQLRELGEELVDIHGQHAWQSLTRASAVRDLLDAYGRIDLVPVRAAHTAWREAAQTLVSALASQANAQIERERLSWQLEELKKLSPGQNEWPELNAQHARAAHAQSLRESALAALHACSESEESAQTALAQAAKHLAERPGVDAVIDELHGRAQALLSQTEDLAHDLRHYLGKDGPDPEQFQQLDERVSLWIGTARRMRSAPGDLHELGLTWQNQLAQLDAANDLESLQKKEQQTKQILGQCANIVSKQREKAAKALAKAVTAHMQALGMPGAAFSVDLQAKEPDGNGAEQVEFLVASHAGAQARAVGKVASGGELSRIALAIAVTTSQLGSVPTLVFDEVDSGVGGQVALTVGQLMRQLGADRQVLCVTHLAQVATHADHHGLVSKTSVAKSAPSSQIAWVAGEDRVREIARMLGGNADSAATLAHATEMIRNAHVTPVSV